MGPDTCILPSSCTSFLTALPPFTQAQEEEWSSVPEALPPPPNWASAWPRVQSVCRGGRGVQRSLPLSQMRVL